MVNFFKSLIEKKLLFVLLVVLSIFRFPICAFLEATPLLRRVSSIAPFVFLLLSSIPIFGVKFLSNITYVLFSLISILTIGILFYIYRDFQIFIDLTGENSILLCIIAFSVLKNDKFKLKEALIKITAITFYIGSLYLIVEFILIKFDYFTPGQIRNWLFQREMILVGHERVNGFLISKEISIVTVLTSWVTYMSFLEVKNKRQLIFSSLLMVASLIASDSMTANLVFIIVFLLLIREKNQVAINSFLAHILILVFAVIFFNSYSSMRLAAYIFGEFDIDKYIPVLTTCANLLLGNNAISKTCTSGEIHSLYPIVKYGFLPSVSWIFVIYISIKATILRSRSSISSLPILSLILMMIHYSGGGSWGTNYIYALLLYCYFQFDSEDVEI